MSVMLTRTRKINIHLKKKNIFHSLIIAHRGKKEFFKPQTMYAKSSFNILNLVFFRCYLLTDLELFWLKKNKQTNKKRTKKKQNKKKTTRKNLK